MDVAILSASSTPTYWSSDDKTAGEALLILMRPVSSLRLTWTEPVASATSNSRAVSGCCSLRDARTDAPAATPAFKSASALVRSRLRPTTPPKTRNVVDAAMPSADKSTIVQSATTRTIPLFPLTDVIPLLRPVLLLLLWRVGRSVLSRGKAILVAVASHRRIRPHWKIVVRQQIDA